MTDAVDMKTAALRYAMAGVPVFPCVGKEPTNKGGLHGATINLDKIARWWDHDPKRNIGMPTGAASGYVVIDLDSDEARGAVKSFPATVTAKTGRGLHAYYKAPEQKIRNSAGKVADHVDVRGDGGYVILPPSLHESGKRYEWINGSGILDSEAVDLSGEQIERIANPRGSDKLHRAENTPDRIIEGGRNSTLTSLAGSARDRGSTAEEIYAYIGAVNNTRCKPPLGDDEVWNIACGVERYSPKHEPDYSHILGLSGRRDIADAIEGGVEPPEELVSGFIYKGGIHSLYGEPGAGKSILALWTCLQVIEQGKPVLYLDEENILRQQSERLRAMGASAEDVRRLFAYYQSPSVTLDPDTLSDLAATVEEVQPALIVFDSWADFLALEGLNENDSVDITRWVKQVVYPARESHEAAALILDHVNREDSGKGGRGSSAKLAKLDAAFKIKVDAPFDRDKLGNVVLYRDKDRDAALSRKLMFKIGGDGSGRLVCERDKFGETTNTLSEDARRVLSTLAECENGLTFTEWFNELELSRGKFSRIIKDLQDAGFVVHDKSDKKYHRVNGPGQSVLDYELGPPEAA